MLRGIAAPCARSVARLPFALVFAAGFTVVFATALRAAGLTAPRFGVVRVFALAMVATP
jgi:hypothetical protein